MDNLDPIVTGLERIWLAADACAKACDKAAEAVEKWGGIEVPRRLLEEGDVGHYDGPLTSGERATLATRPITLPDVVLLDAIAAAEPEPCPHCGCREVEVMEEQPAEPECGVAACGQLTLCADCGHILHEAPTRAEVREEIREAMEGGN